MNDVARLVLSLVASVMSLSILAVLVSSKAQTGSVIGAAAGGLAEIITAADGPVTGQVGSIGSFGGSSGSNLGGGFNPSSLLSSFLGAGGF